MKLVEVEADRIHPPPPPNGKVLPWQQCAQRIEDMDPASYGPRGGDMGWRIGHYGPKGLDPYRCTRGAAVELNGKRLCGLHAGQLALRIY